VDRRLLYMCGAGSPRANGRALRTLRAVLRQAAAADESVPCHRVVPQNRRVDADVQSQLADEGVLFVQEDGMLCVDPTCVWTPPTREEMMARIERRFNNMATAARTALLALVGLDTAGNEQQQHT
jgi:alkylated DNA nucleotide flippase Atl1